MGNNKKLKQINDTTSQILEKIKKEESKEKSKVIKSIEIIGLFISILAGLVGIAFSIRSCVLENRKSSNEIKNVVNIQPYEATSNGIISTAKMIPSKADIYYEGKYKIYFLVNKEIMQLPHNDNNNSIFINITLQNFNDFEIIIDGIDVEVNSYQQIDDYKAFCWEYSGGYYHTSLTYKKIYKVNIDNTEGIYSANLHGHDNESLDKTYYQKLASGEIEYIDLTVNNTESGIYNISIYANCIYGSEEKSIKVMDYIYYIPNDQFFYTTYGSAKIADEMSKFYGIDDYHSYDYLNEKRNELKAKISTDENEIEIMINTELEEWKQKVLK